MNSLHQWAILILAVALAAWILIVSPAQRRAAYKAGENSAKVNELLEESRQRGDYWMEQAKGHDMSAEVFKATIDSLTAIIQNHAPQHYPRVPSGIPSTERRDRILSGIAKPL